MICEQRGFKCMVYEGTYQGEVTVWVDSEAIEFNGNDAIKIAAEKEWRRQFGPSIGLAYR